MPKIVFVPEGGEVEAVSGETIVDAALRTGQVIAHICGGRARCSTCRVEIVQGREHLSPPGKEEQAVARRLRFAPGVRLGCQARVHGDVSVRRLVQENGEKSEVASLYVVGPETGTTGVEKEIHIMFADIIGFTAFSENLLPYDVIHVLNHFFHSMGEVISRHGGHIDTYLGDGFMARFEGESPRRGALRAVQAGLEMLEEIEKLRPYLQELFHKDFAIRIGLHFGDVVAGTVGAAGRKKTTIIGDAVNVASRIEAANKQLGTHFLVSADIYAQVQESVKVGRCASLRFPGKTGEYTLYEVIGLQCESP